METTETTTYLPSTERVKRTLAQVQKEHCLARIAISTAEVSSIEADILRLTETRIAAAASSGAVSVPELDDLGEQIERLHRRKSTTHAILAAQNKELEQLRKQLRAEAILEVRSEFDSKMAARTAKARDLVATIQIAIALIGEIDLLGRQSIGLFRGDHGPSFAELNQAINRINVQGEVEKLFASALPRLWNDADGVRPDAQFKSPLPDRIDAERRAVDAMTDLALERITS